MVETLRILLICSLLVIGAEGRADPMVITYADGEEGDTRYQYGVDLVDLALRKSGIEYELVSKPRPASNERVAHLMQTEGAYDIAFFGTRPELESRLRAIYFPMYHGLLGYRIGIINSASREKMKQVQTLEDFKNLRICQGTGWTDTKILEEAGMTVATGVYRNLFRMVAAGRCDIFLRAVFEVDHEIAENSKDLPDLAVDDEILIKYKLASFIFVNPAKEDLAQAIEAGLELAVQDGSFQEFFLSQDKVQEARQRLNLPERNCIKIKHSFLSDQTAALPDSAWTGLAFEETDDAARCKLVGVIGAD